MCVCVYTHTDKYLSLIHILTVVFDCSAKTTTNLSLNDISLVGPTVQSPLISIITKFRTHPYVMTADIEKMYRQINVHPLQQNLQLILWRERPEDPVKTYKLLTITYGQASAPYLATRVLKQLALDEQANFPSVISKTLIEDVYVDDLLCRTKSIELAKQMHKDLCELANRGGFHLRKWTSNHPDILRDISRKNKGQECFEINQDTTVKTLGLIWDSKEDTFQFVINKKNMMSSAPTKRTIL